MYTSTVSRPVKSDSETQYLMPNLIRTIHPHPACQNFLARVAKILGHFLMFDFESYNDRAGGAILSSGCMSYKQFFYWSGQEVGVVSVYISTTVIMKYLQCNF